MTEKHEGDSSFRLLLQETTAATGMDYLRLLARNTARALGARWSFIGRLVEDDPEQIRVLVLWDRDHYGEPFVYEVRGTPCANTSAGQLCHYPSGVQELFRGDAMLVDMGAEGYSGIGISDRGRTIGVLAALYDHPAGPLEGVEPLLRVAASRAALEIERMESDAALRASEARYRNFVEQCIEGVWSIDARGVTDFVNPQMAQMLGVRPEDMLGRPMYDFMDDQARAEAEQNLDRRNRGIRERHSFRLVHADGSDVWTEMATNPIVDESGNIVGALALVTDMTEHRRLQESMQQRQKLESLGLLAGGVAHDFNNLLVGILGNADLAFMQSDLSPTLEGLLEQIQSAALQAADLTSQLLAYAGRSPLRAEPLSVSELVEEVAGMLRAVVPPRVRLQLTTAESLPPIDADRTQLTQVLMNLVTNAGDALGEAGGEVRISTGLLPPGDELLARSYVAGAPDPVEHVFIRVADDGVGMDAKTRAHLFDPFFTTKGSGHGLGLAAVLGILNRHQGTIVIDSAPGEGSTFTVCIPVSHRPASAAVARSGSSSVLAERFLEGRRVLLADDESLVRTVLGTMMRSSGAEVDEATDGEEALALLAEASVPYDVIVLDMAMPKMGGAEALRRLRADGWETPVILCSGHASFSLPDQPGTTWLPKPFRASDLRNALQAVLGD